MAKNWAIWVTFGRNGKDVLFIFKDGLGDILNADYKTGVAFLTFAIFSWALGTIYVKKFGNNSNTIALNIFYQFMTAAVIQIVLANCLYSDSNYQNWSQKSIFAVILAVKNIKKHLY